MLVRSERKGRFQTVSHLMEHAWLGKTVGSLTYLNVNGRKEIRKEGRLKSKRMPDTYIHDQ